MFNIDEPVLLWEDLWSLDQLRDQGNMSWLWKWVVWLRVLITLLFALWGFSLNYLISCHWISVSLSHWTWRNIFVIFIHHVKLFHQLNTQEMTFYQQLIIETESPGDCTERDKRVHSKQFSECWKLHCIIQINSEIKFLCWNEFWQLNKLQGSLCSEKKLFQRCSDWVDSRC